MGQDAVPRLARFFGGAERSFQVLLLFLDPCSEKVGIGDALFHLVETVVIRNPMVIFQRRRGCLERFLPRSKRLVRVQVAHKGEMLRDGVADLSQAIVTVALGAFVLCIVSRHLQQVVGQVFLQEYLGGMGLVLLLLQEELAQKHVGTNEGITGELVLVQEPPERAGLDDVHVIRAGGCSRCRKRQPDHLAHEGDLQGRHEFLDLPNHGLAFRIVQNPCQHCWEVLECRLLGQETDVQGDHVPQVGPRFEVLDILQENGIFLLGNPVADHGSGRVL
mmetsp:Transcript_3272/g.9049  ORF Transcript_3272/g.9049 Transcript_3272/m.9049 type:complete len:276 (+) Transcript_3272:581-1408(+)